MGLVSTFTNRLELIIKENENQQEELEQMSLADVTPVVLLKISVYPQT